VTAVAAQTIPRKRWAIDRAQLVILLVAAVMLGSFLLLVLWPKQCELSALGSAVRRERELVSRKVRTSHEGLYVSARTSGLRKTQGLLDRRLPPEPRVAEFLQGIGERVLAEPGVAHEVQRGEPAVGGAAPATPLRLRLSGPVEGVYRCLAGIEGMERLNRFRRVHVRRSDDGRGVVADADIVVYHLPRAAAGARPVEEKPSAGPPSPTPPSAEG